MSSLESILKQLNSNIEQAKTCIDDLKRNQQLHQDKSTSHFTDFVDIVNKTNDALKCFCDGYKRMNSLARQEEAGSEAQALAESSSSTNDNNFWGDDDVDDMSILSCIEDVDGNDATVVEDDSVADDEAMLGIVNEAEVDDLMGNLDDDTLNGVTENEEEFFAEEDNEVDSALELAFENLEEENDDDGKLPSIAHLDVLKEYFGFSKFRPMQWQIVSSILHQKRDNCVVMATGAGKSLCYQFPAVFTAGVAVVVSPLISLMEDQVQILNSSNISACYLGSGQTGSSAAIRDGIFRGDYRLVYVTPEYLCAGHTFLKDLSERVTLTCIAIDEAHCVSQWGYDFRTSYQKLSFIKDVVPSVPVLALTATATPLVRKDICKNLKLKNPILRCTSFDRENLFLEVRHKTSIAYDMKSLMNCNSNKYSFVGPTIIYCPTKKMTSSVADVLTSLGVSCATYHAGMGLKDRKQNQLKFMNDELQCVVATVAFGMGIDKPDVRMVVHYGAPKDIESYYQEIGRAGRDGQPSYCCVFYNNKDFALSRRFLSDISNIVFRRHKNEMLLKLEKFITTSSCRRKTILAHFEDKPSQVGGHKECCDNCLQAIRNSKTTHSTTSNFSSSTSMQEEQLDIGKDVKMLLEVIQETGDGKFGLTVPILILRGSGSQKVTQYSSSKLLGVGKRNSEKYWRAVGRDLVAKGYLQETAVQQGYGSTVGTTQKARLWLSKQRDNDNPSFILKEASKDILYEKNNKLAPDQAKPEASAQLLKRILKKVPIDNAWKHPIGPYYSLLTNIEAVPTKVTETQDKLEKQLLSKCQEIRQDLSKKFKIPPVKVCNNSMMADMVKIRPSSVEKMQVIMDEYEDNTFYPHHFAQPFLKEIREFCDCHGASMDNFDVYSVNEDVVEDNESIILERKDQQSLNITETQTTSYNFHKQSFNIDEIVKKRALVEDTIYGHLSGALLAGFKIELNLLDISKADVSHVVHVVRSCDINSDIGSFRPIKEKLPVDIGFGKLKFILGMLEITFGIEGESSSGKKAAFTIPAFIRSTSEPTPHLNSAVVTENGNHDQTSTVTTTAKKRKMPNWVNSANATTYKRKSQNKRSKPFL